MRKYGSASRVVAFQSKILVLSSEINDSYNIWGAMLESEHIVLLTSFANLSVMFAQC